MSDEPLEDRLRAALAGRADEVGHPGADERALSRRARDRARARARRRAAWAGVAAVVLLGGAVWRVAEQPGSTHEVRTGPPPPREEPASTCAVPASTPDSIAVLDLPGFGLHLADLGGRPADSQGPRSLSLYLDATGPIDSALVVTVDERTEVSTAGSAVTLEGGREATVRTRSDGVDVTWALADGSAVTVDGLGIDREVVLAAAAEADRDLTAAAGAPVVLDEPPAGLVLFDASGPAPDVPVWRTTWTDGVGASVDMSATTDAGTRLALDITRGFGVVDASWIEVAGEPAVLVAWEDVVEIHWHRADGWDVSVRATLPADRAPAVAAALCGLAQDDWPAVERRAAEEGAEWDIPPETVTATADPPG